jgi:hypothetical protein
VPLALLVPLKEFVMDAIPQLSVAVNAGIVTTAEHAPPAFTVTSAGQVKVGLILSTTVKVLLQVVVSGTEPSVVAE